MPHVCIHTLMRHVHALHTAHRLHGHCFGLAKHHDIGCRCHVQRRTTTQADAHTNLSSFNSLHVIKHTSDQDGTIRAFETSFM